ncbi:MAG TPA: hypothetical protein VNH63_13985 [Gemmatimonadales bacterium]|nr:hypothetical protein [Gemmatimonadales bacterium]
MPPLTRWYIKTGFVYLVVALLGALLLAAAPLIRLPASVMAAGPAQIHAFVVGWLTQLIFGVAYWMFPKFSPEQPRGHNSIAVAAYVLLNAGLLARIVAEPWQAVHAGPWPAYLLVAAAVAQWLGGVGFVLNTWPRVRVK